MIHNPQAYPMAHSGDADLAYGCACVEAELGALESRCLAGLQMDDYGDAMMVAGGTAAGAGAATSSAALLAAGGGAATGFSAAGTMAAGGAGMLASGATAGSTAATAGAVGLFAPAALIVAPAAVAAAGAAWALSWRADVKNVSRLKAKIKKLRVTMRARVASARSSGQKRRLKNRYGRRISRAQRRLARIERVMRRRIAKRKSRGKGLTGRQKRMAAAVGIKRRGKGVRKAAAARRAAGSGASRGTYTPPWGARMQAQRMAAQRVPHTAYGPLLPNGIPQGSYDQPGPVAQYVQSGEYAEDMAEEQDGYGSLMGGSSSWVPLALLLGGVIWAAS